MIDGLERKLVPWSCSRSSHARRRPARAAGQARLHAGAGEAHRVAGAGVRALASTGGRSSPFFQQQSFILFPPPPPLPFTTSLPTYFCSLSFSFFKKTAGAATVGQAHRRRRASSTSTSSSGALVGPSRANIITWCTDSSSKLACADRRHSSAPPLQAGNAALSRPGVLEDGGVHLHLAGDGIPARVAAADGGLAMLFRRTSPLWHRQTVPRLAARSPGPTRSAHGRQRRAEARIAHHSGCC